MRIGQTHIDFDAHHINGPAGSFVIEPKVMQVLSVLVENAGQVVTRDSLIDQVWGVGYGGDERLSRAISLLRKAFGDTRGKSVYIQTIPKTGYKFIPEIDGTADPKSIEIYEVSLSELSKPSKRSTWLKTIISIAAALFAIAASSLFSNRQLITSPAEPPLVMIMDSAHPARVYDEDIRQQGATNADILSDILADLPVRTQKELISPNWDRYEAISQFDPDLILIHYSGFKQADASGDRPQLRLLIDYFSNTETEFLVYSRASNDWLNDNMDIVLEELYTKNPTIRNRVKIFPLLEYGDPYWRDLGSAQGIKLKVKKILALEPT